MTMMADLYETSR